MKHKNDILIKKMQDKDIKNFEEANIKVSENSNFINQTNNKKYIIIGAAILMLLCGGVGYYLYKEKKSSSKIADVQAIQDENKVMFIPLNEIFVTLNSGSVTNKVFIKIKLCLEVQGKKNYDTIIDLNPKIMDVLQTYLFNINKNDLNGSFGIYKMRDEMTMRINTIVYPAKVNNILFQELVVQ